MWSADIVPVKSDLNGLPLVPREVLYYFDGPILFVSRIGLVDFLCQKFDEDGQSDFFILSQVDEATVGALKAGRLSVRGAIENDRYWVVKVGVALQVQAVWPVTELEFPTKFLPQRHLGLSHTEDYIPDAIEQADGFFSVKYQGPDLRRGSISFRRFKALIGEVYEVATNYIMPAMSGNLSKSSILDFDIAPPKLASLLISIKEPVVLADAIKRRKLNVAPAENFVQAMRRQRNDLMEGITTVVGRAQKGDLDTNFAGENMTWIAALNTISPSRTNDISSVEISTRADESSDFVILNAEVGDRIKTAHREIIRAPVALSGTVFEINGGSSSFVFRANGLRQTTCKLPLHLFEQYERDGLLRYGASVIVRGQFERRDRRDLIVANEVIFPS
jgi:hypothetical protein